MGTRQIEQSVINKDRLIGVVAAVLSIAYAVGSILTVWAMDSQGMWNEVAVIAFTAGLFGGVGGIGLSFLVYSGVGE